MVFELGDRVGVVDDGGNPERVARQALKARRQVGVQHLAGEVELAGFGVGEGHQGAEAREPWVLVQRLRQQRRQLADPPFLPADAAELADVGGEGVGLGAVPGALDRPLSTGLGLVELPVQRQMQQLRPFAQPAGGGVTATAGDPLLLAQRARRGLDLADLQLRHRLPMESVEQLERLIQLRSDLDALGRHRDPLGGVVGVPAGNQATDQHLGEDAAVAGLARCGRAHLRQPATAVGLVGEGQLQRQLGKHQGRFRTVPVESLSGASKHRGALAVEAAHPRDEAAVVRERRRDQPIDFAEAVGQARRSQQAFSRALLVRVAERDAEADQQVAELDVFAVLAAPLQRPLEPARRQLVVIAAQCRFAGLGAVAGGPLAISRLGAPPVVGELGGSALAGQQPRLRLELFAEAPVQLPPRRGLDLLVEAVGDDRVAEGAAAVALGRDQAGTLRRSQRILDRFGVDPVPAARSAGAKVRPRAAATDRQVKAGSPRACARAATSIRSPLGADGRGGEGAPTSPIARSSSQAKRALPPLSRPTAAVARSSAASSASGFREEAMSRRAAGPEGAELQLPGAGLRVELGDRLGRLAARVNVGGAVGGQEQERSSTPRPGQVSDQGEGRGGAGVQVVDRQQQRPVAGSVLEGDSAAANSLARSSLSPHGASPPDSAISAPSPERCSSLCSGSVPWRLRSPRAATNGA